MIPKILVVDDNDSITLLLSLTLKTEGCDVETVADGMEAFQKFQLNEPDVLVTDLVMPFDLEAFAAQVKNLLTNWRESQSRPQSLGDEAESISS